MKGKFYEKKQTQKAHNLHGNE